MRVNMEFTIKYDEKKGTLIAYPNTDLEGLTLKLLQKEHTLEIMYEPYKEILIGVADYLGNPFLNYTKEEG